MRSITLMEVATVGFAVVIWLLVLVIAGLDAIRKALNEIAGNTRKPLEWDDDL